MKPEIQTTADGSMTLYRKDLDEHYHSVKGALAESKHVYVKLGWNHLAQSKEDSGLYCDEIRVFEVGFGTGLNAALTAAEALRRKRRTYYFSIELYPLDAILMKEFTEFSPPEIKDTVKAVNEAPWNQRVEINEYFTLAKIEGNLLKSELPVSIDVIYFDAFAPDKQPEMWSREVFEKCFEAMTTGAVLTTYCAKGAVRRLLQGVGFRVERLPGPPDGKREVLRATVEPR